jgi:glycogen debranching enzyme
MSYHNGSVWPHDNSLIAAGLRRSGYTGQALRIIQETFDAGYRLAGYRIPELYCGFSRDRRYQSSPAAYPVSCTPQSWAAGSIFLMLQHLLGIEPDLPHRRVVIRPALLPGVDRLTFEDMRVGSYVLRIDVRRRNGRVTCEVAGAGGLDVAIYPAE